ncbi:hypothetical protein MAP00_004052 [Monascus purpureus]|nr:hypothetical protein MAP00_004052 [Monascus purpureus]
MLWGIVVMLACPVWAGLAIDFSQLEPVTESKLEEQHAHLLQHLQRSSGKWDSTRQKSHQLGDRTSVSQAMKHFVRDWADEGHEERQQAFPCILNSWNRYHRRVGILCECWCREQG